ncbi:MAG: hypothetical protein RR293_08140, partial [Bacteroidales bacterium]
PKRYSERGILLFEELMWRMWRGIDLNKYRSVSRRVGYAANHAMRIWALIQRLALRYFRV